MSEHDTDFYAALCFFIAYGFVGFVALAWVGIDIWITYRENKRLEKSEPRHD
jgi:hypothetical protein